MKVTEVVLPGVGEPESFELRHRELPALKQGEALVRMEVAGVSFAEQQMRRGRYPMAPKFPFVPGYDMVGTIEALGPDTDGVSVGDRVAVLNNKSGGWASHAVRPVAALTPVPDGVSAEQAETLLMNGLSAWQMLHRVAKVRKGQTVLVQGASGGVGVLLAQLAVLAGATVIGTASAAKHDLLREHGVRPVDYRKDVVAEVRALAPDGLDAVFDHVGFASARSLRPLLKRTGTIVMYGSLSTLDDKGWAMGPFLQMIAWGLVQNLTPGTPRTAFYDVNKGRRNADRFNAQTRADLGEVFALAQSGQLTGEVAGRFPLDQVAGAIRLAESGGGAGKVLLLPPSS
jgi:synaptic vesicle membrane protein VAT-1